MSEEAEKNRLVGRVTALLKGREEAEQRSNEEVPLLTEILAAEPPAPGADVQRGALAADLERALLARLVPELERRCAGLRSALEEDLRRAVREALAHALAAREPEPPAQ